MTERRRVIVAENMSANGVIEFLDPWFDPVDQDEEDLLDVVRGHIETEDALLLGRKTFLDFRGYWPIQTDDTTGFTAHLNQVQKYVFSSTIQEPGWENATVLRRSVVEEVQLLKDQPGGDIGITGSISIVHELMRQNLVDEYRLFVYPVITSKGRNLVPNDLDMGRLKLLERRAFRSGVVLLTYSR